MNTMCVHLHSRGGIGLFPAGVHRLIRICRPEMNWRFIYSVWFCIQKFFREQVFLKFSPAAQLFKLNTIPTKIQILKKKGKKKNNWSSIR